MPGIEPTAVFGCPVRRGGGIDLADRYVKRYSAKLLFQFRVDLGPDTGKRRTCEERIVLIEARSASSALSKAKRKGKKAELDYKNVEGNTVYFEFVGVMDLLHLGVECDDDEVWYDIYERLSPMERRDVFIPPEHELNAMRCTTS